METVYLGGDSPKGVGGEHPVYRIVRLSESVEGAFVPGVDVEKGCACREQLISRRFFVGIEVAGDEEGMRSRLSRDPSLDHLRGGFYG